MAEEVCDYFWTSFVRTIETDACYMEEQIEHIPPDPTLSTEYNGYPLMAGEEVTFNSSGAEVIYVAGQGIPANAAYVFGTSSNPGALKSSPGGGTFAFSNETGNDSYYVPAAGRIDLRLYNESDLPTNYDEDTHRLILECDFVSDGGSGTLWLELFYILQYRDLSGIFDAVRVSRYCSKKEAEKANALFNQSQDYEVLEDPIVGYVFSTFNAIHSGKGTVFAGGQGQLANIASVSSHATHLLDYSGGPTKPIRFTDFNETNVDVDTTKLTNVSITPVRYLIAPYVLIAYEDTEILSTTEPPEVLTNDTNAELSLTRVAASQAV